MLRQIEMGPLSRVALVHRWPSKAVPRLQRVAKDRRTGGSVDNLGRLHVQLTGGWATFF